MRFIVSFIEIVMVFASILAAYYWYKSSAGLPFNQGEGIAIVDDKGNVESDIVHMYKVMKHQTKFNKQAALFAGIAALCQAFITIFQYLKS
jgi:hypothetical protein